MVSSIETKSSYETLAFIPTLPVGSFLLHGGTAPHLHSWEPSGFMNLSGRLSGHWEFLASATGLLQPDYQGDEYATGEGRYITRG